LTGRPVPTAGPGDEPAGAGLDSVAALVASRVRDVPDFPRPGIQFKDLTPLFADGPAFRAAVAAMLRQRDRGSFDVVVGIEARGFLVAAAVACAAGTGVVPVRKAGKLPWHSVSARYELEYGEATVEMHEDAFATARRALIVDDVLATGGTLAAAADLVGRAGGQVAGMSVLLELAALGGRSRLSGYDVHSLLTV
jgi:adenine phosphoribosyltransferase